MLIALWSISAGLLLGVRGSSFEPAACAAMGLRDLEQPAVPGAAAPAEVPIVIPEPMGFISDSPTASDTLRRIGEHLRVSNIDPAAALLRQLLAESPHALVPLESDPDVHVTVRSRARKLLLSSPPLLQRLRDTVLAETQRLEQEGDWQALERCWFFSPAGQNASVQLAWSHLSAGRIDAARLTLADLFEPASIAVSQRALMERLTDALASATPAAATPLLPSALSALDPMPAVELDSLVPLPLASARIGPAAEPEFGPRLAGLRPDQLNDATLLRSMPTHGVFPLVVDRTVFVAGTHTLSALNLPDLSVKWKIDVPEATGVPEQMRRTLTASYRPRMSNPLLEEISTVTWFGRAVATRPAGQSSPAGVLVVVASFEEAQNSLTVQILAGIDAQTGQVRWYRPVERLDPSLEANATVRGPVLASGDTAIVTVRKYQPDRRLGAALMFGIDAWTGESRWSAPITSAGLINGNLVPLATEQSVIESGIVYRADRLGAVSAHAAHDGRPIWVRRVATPLFDQTASTRPFTATAPIVTGDMVICQSADRRIISLIDRGTGGQIGNFPAFYLESPLYLLKAGSRLVGIGDRIVAAAEISRLVEFARFAAANKPQAVNPQGVALQGQRPMDTFATFDQSKRPAGGVVTAAVSTTRGGWARAAVMGDELVIPEVSSLVIVNLSSMQVRTVRVDATGNALAMMLPGPPGTGAGRAGANAAASASMPAIASGILLCTDTTLSSVLSLDGSLRSLRMAMAEPARTMPSALALGKLAARLGKPDLLAEALQAAAEAQSTSATGSDQRELVSLGIAALLESTAGAAGQRIVTHLKILAQNQIQRGAIALGEGKLILAGGGAAQSFALAQQIATDESVATLVYRDERMALRLGDAASVLMRDALAGMNGQERAVIDAAAADRLAALRMPRPMDGPVTIDTLVAFAARYPFTPATLEALSLAAEMAEKQGLPIRQSRLLQSAISTALATPRSENMRRELTRLLSSRLRARGLGDAVAEVETMVAAGSPPVTPATALPAAPEAKRLSGVATQGLSGWAVAPPLLGGELPTCVLKRGELPTRHQDGRLALFARADGSEPLAPLSERWSLPGRQRSDVLVADGEVMVLIDRTDGALTRLDKATGTPIWNTKGLVELVGGARGGQVPAPGPGAAVGENGTSRGTPQNEIRRDELSQRRLPTMRGGAAIEVPRSAEEVLLSYDGQSIALVQRAGVIAVVSAESGELMLSARLPADTSVTDAKLTGGVLAVGTSGPGDEPKLCMFKVGRRGRAGDAGAEGRLVQPDMTLVLPTAAGAVQAVRSTAWGEIITVQNKAVGCYSPESERPLWTIDDLLLDVSDAWVVRGTLLLADSERRLWTVALDRGTLYAGPAMRGAILHGGVPQFSPALAAPGLPAGTIALSGSSEFKLIAPDGTLLTSDALGAVDGSLLPPVRIGGSVFAVASVASRVRDDALIFSVTALEATTARALWSGSLLLPVAPHRAVACGDALAVTAGHSTVLYRTEAVR